MGRRRRCWRSEPGPRLIARAARCQSGTSNGAAIPRIGVGRIAIALRRSLPFCACFFFRLTLLCCLSSFLERFLRSSESALRVIRGMRPATATRAVRPLRTIFPTSTISLGGNRQAFIAIDAGRSRLTETSSPAVSLGRDRNAPAVGCAHISPIAIIAIGANACRVSAQATAVRANLPRLAVCRSAATDNATWHDAAAAGAIGFRVRNRKYKIGEDGKSQQKAGANYRIIENIRAGAAYVNAAEHDPAPPSSGSCFRT